MELDYCGFSILDACLGVTLWQAETPAQGELDDGVIRYMLYVNRRLHTRAGSQTVRTTQVTTCIVSV